MTQATDGQKQFAPEIVHRESLQRFGEQNGDKLDASRRRNRYFHRYLNKLVSNQVLPGSRVLDIGCADGDMLASLKPSYGVGVDINRRDLKLAAERHPELTFLELAAEDVTKIGETFDYIILSGVLPQLYDLHTALEALRSVCHDRTRIIITTFSRVWQPAIKTGESIGMKTRVPEESWLPPIEVKSILHQCDFDIVRQSENILCPMGLLGLGSLVNRWIAPLPVFRNFCLCTVSVARMLPRTNRVEIPKKVSVIIAARNEAGNIQPLLDRIPQMGEKTEVIFVEGNSKDDTWDVIQKVVASYTGPMEVRAYKQTGKGKGDAVRLGFAEATGDILMILDADISVPPEELPRFVDVIAKHQCEFANGSRLVYPMDKQAMQFLNMIANKSFGWMFTYLLGQRMRDTLCGTKVLRKTDYEKIVANRAYFGDFDPFGDFDLLFGAARLNLKIVDVPVHYKERVYGSTNISRFRHGWMLLQMCGFAARKIKFI